MSTMEYLYWQNLSLMIVQLGFSFFVLCVDFVGIIACVWFLRKLWK